MKFIVLAAISLIIFPACTRCEWTTNQDERQRLFRECMELLPAGPEQTKYNDWDDVVAQCDDVAYKQAIEKICE